MKKNSALPLLCLLALTTCLTACSPGKQAFRSAQELNLKGDYDGAVTKYMEAVDRAPNRQEYRLRLDSTLAKAAWKHLELGRERIKEGKRSEAVEEFRKALEYDKTLGAAENELKVAERLLRADKLVLQADDFIRNRRLQQARANLDEALLLDPENAAARELLDKIKAGPRTVVDGVELDVTSAKPITLKFKDTDIKDAFNILSKLTGVNFLLDADVKKQSFTFELIDVSFPQALELMLQMHKLGKKVLNSRTIIIYSKSKEGEKQFTDQLIQTFYLSNIDAKKAVNLLRTMLQLRRVYVHEELNAIIVRDSADVIKLAGQMLEAADRADAEVTFDLELIEVNHSDELKFGPKTGTSISYGLGKMGEIVNDTTGVVTGERNVIVAGGLISGGSTVNLVSSLSNLKTFYSLPTLIFDFLKTRTDAEVLANPKIRVKNREKAKVNIGTKEPVVSVTLNGDIQSETVTYVDVGVKLDVEPTIQLDDSVVTKLSLTVSSVSDRKTVGLGTQVLTLTTTEASSVLTLRDGERTIIGGLIRDDETKSRTGIAFISDLPIIGPLLTSHDNKKIKREILLSITPHIVQNVVVPQADVGTIWSGGEEDLKAGPMYGSFAELPIEAASLQTVTPAAVTPSPAVAPAPIVPPTVPLTEENQPSDAPVPVILPEATDPVVTPEPTPEVPAAAPTGAEGTPPPEVAPEVVPPAPSAAVVALPPFTVPPTGDGRLLVSGPAQAMLGSEVTLEVWGKEMKELYSAPLFVSYDAERFELVKATEGEFLKQGNAPTIFTSTLLANKGELIVGYKQGVGGRGASGDGVLFRLILRAKAVGAAQVRLDRLNLRSAAGNRLKVESTPLTMEIR